MSVEVDATNPEITYGDWQSTTIHMSLQPVPYVSVGQSNNGTPIETNWWTKSVMVENQPFWMLPTPPVGGWEVLSSPVATDPTNGYTAYAVMRPRVHSDPNNSKCDAVKYPNDYLECPVDFSGNQVLVKTTDGVKWKEVYRPPSNHFIGARDWPSRRRVVVSRSLNSNSKKSCYI